MMKIHDYLDSDEYKRLNKIRSSQNDLDKKIGDLVIPNTDRQVVILDPFEYDSISHLTETNYLIARGKLKAGCNLVTNQMAILELLEYGKEQIYITTDKGDVVEISNETLDISKEIRPVHNLFRMWRSGGLGEQFR